MNYHLFLTIETNGGIDTIRYEFCFLNNKRRLIPSHRIEH
jgi:hypothetical protein